MPEPVLVATSIFSGFNSFVKAISLAAHYKEVPNEVKQLHTNIERAESSINIANRLLRSKAHYLDPRLVQETEESVDKTNHVLLLVRDSIESCRKDLEIRETVTPKNRVAWLLWKNQEFLSQLQTLGNCLGALDRDIGRLEMAHAPIVFVSGSYAPSAYADSDRKGGTLATTTTFGIGAADDEDEKPPFPRSPTKRLRSKSRSNNSSQVNLSPNKRAAATRRGASRTLSLQLADGDEGYESEDQTTQDAAEDPVVFANATIGIDTSGTGLGFTISQGHGQLNVRQVNILHEASTPTIATGTPRSGPEMAELPVSPEPHTEVEHQVKSTPDPDAVPPAIPNPYAFSSKNPWRRLALQQSTSTLNSSVALSQREDPPNAVDYDAASMISTTTTAAGDAEADESDGTARNLLRLSLTAPAGSSGSGPGSGPGPGSTVTEAKKVKWRRKSGFI
ncbi:hypothetical protein PV04_05996 [Phialophora macrospora]|uniref:Fungal N-terminal domain-containing protein n=1 Tax=Phialophora macrospora TaxID=1851006 RepID=A0A0D2FF74_9EURO|nr:hypothetical protein PV04_05996 [Phialophora macrospora]